MQYLVALEETGCASATLKPRLETLLPSVDVYCFSTLTQLDEDIADVATLLACRRATLYTLKSHYGAVHTGDVGRLEGEARQVRISLAVAQREFANENSYHLALVDSAFGKRPRWEHESDLLSSLDAKIGMLCSVAKRRHVATGGEQRLVDVHLEIVRRELRDDRVVEIRRCLLERRGGCDSLSAMWLN